LRTLSESPGNALKRSVVLAARPGALTATESPSLRASIPARRARFVAFDLLHCDGQDLTYSPLIECSSGFVPSCPKRSIELQFKAEMQ